MSITSKNAGALLWTR